MAANPWDKFFWNDWENDPALKLCSLAAQGLWMRCLCICAKAEPKGYLLVAGRRLSPVDLATLVGRPETEVETLLNELASAGVFSRDRQGRIYSRRMVRDYQRTAAERKAGKEGGNPNIRRGTVPKNERVRPFKRTDSPAKTRRIFARDGGRCHWCKTELAWKSDDGLVPNLFHVDHLIPVCDGGTNDEENLVAACASCNHARARKDWQNPSDTNPDRNTDSKAHKPEAKSQRPELEKDRGADAPPAYAFVGRVIRLNRDDFERWRTTYSAVPDFVAALQAADDYYGQNPPKDGKWFFPVSRWLEKAHKDELEKRRQRTQPFQRYAL